MKIKKEVFIIIFIVMVIIISSLFAIQVINRGQQYYDLQCKKIGYDRYLREYGNYCVNNNSAIEVLMTNGGFVPIKK